jgi:hypothetical protein
MPGDHDNALGRYSAKLLFEFHVKLKGAQGVRRLCEERIIVVRASNARDALRVAIREAGASEFRYRNNNGDPVHFRLVGVMDLLHLGVECEPNEVWYDITQRVRPYERRAKILPRTAELQAFREEAMPRGQRKVRGLKAGAAQQRDAADEVRAGHGRRGPRS